MPKFSDVTAGTYARRTIELDINGRREKIDLRILTPDEEASVISGATAYAKEYGAEKMQPGEGLFDLGLWIHTAAVACIDNESSIDRPEPYFNGGPEQIRRSKLITRSHLAYIYENQEAWQTECSPYERVMDDAALMARIAPIAEGDIRPFVALPPFMRWLFTRGVAKQLVTLRAERLLLGGLSRETSEEAVS